MIRAALILLGFLVIALMVAAGFALAGEAGLASVEWLGWRVNMTAAAALCAVLTLTFVAVSVWRLLLWIIETPTRNARARSEGRRKQGAEALAKGFLAAAAGDGSEARRLAQRAAELDQDNPASASWPPRPPKPPATSPPHGPPTTPCWASRRCGWPATRG